MNVNKLLVGIPLILAGCVSLPHGGDIQAIVDEYDQTIEFAQSSIEYAQCLDTISLPNTPLSDPENFALRTQIRQLANLILRENIVSEQTSQAKRNCVPDAPHNLICPRLLVTYPSFETFIDESSLLQNSLRARLLNGETVLSGKAKELEIIDNHREAATTGDVFSSKPTPVSVYALTSNLPSLSVSRLATRISNLALQASYFSDDLDHQAIYECSNIKGAYDKRFNGTNGLTFDEAQASVDFSGMTEDERRISTSDKLEEIYNRYDDVKDTIKTLENLF